MLGVEACCNCHGLAAVHADGGSDAGAGLKVVMVVLAIMFCCSKQIPSIPDFTTSAVKVRVHSLDDV